MNNDFSDITFNRKTVKVFDTNCKISHEEMLEILNETVTAPSSVNFQPWRFIVVESKEGKEKLRPLVQDNTRQNDTSSAMILIFGDLECQKNADEITNRAIEAGFMSQEVKDHVMNVAVPSFEQASREKLNDIVKMDCALAAMQLMLIARAHGYDTNAIGGFDHDKLGEVFGMDSQRYVPALIIAIGKSNYKSHDTIRLDAQEVTSFA